MCIRDSLSSPEIAAEQRLVPAISKYVFFLQKNCDQLEAECHIEHMLETNLDRNMRRTFKTAEFQSIGHLLEVCQSYRDELQTVALPQDNSEDISQALKDLQREVIAVNGSVLPFVSNHSDLVQLLTSSLSTLPFYYGTMRRRTKKKSKKKSKDDEVSVDEDDSESDENESKDDSSSSSSESDNEENNNGSRPGVGRRVSFDDNVEISILSPKAPEEKRACFYNRQDLQRFDMENKQRKAEEAQESLMALIAETGSTLGVSLPSFTG